MPDSSNTINFKEAYAGHGPTLYASAAFTDDLNNEDPFYPRTRLCQFVLSNQRWLLHDLPFYTMGLRPVVEIGSRSETLAATCIQGAIFFKDSLEGRVERLYPETMVRADILNLVQINNGLYACGANGQLYEKFGGNWELLDPSLLPDYRGMREALDAAMDDIDKLLAVDLSPWMGQDRIKTFGHINGPHEYEIYVTGYDGGLLLWNGERSHWITEGIPKNNLFEIVVEDEKRIWICGSKGTLLCGNHKDGFQDLSPGGDLSFNSMTLFQGKLWITANGGFGGPTGLFTYHNGRLDRVTTGLTPDIDDIHTVTSADGVLWTLGFRDILCFDGKIWTRIDYPGNPPVR